MLLIKMADVRVQTKNKSRFYEFRRQRFGWTKTSDVNKKHNRSHVRSLFAKNKPMIYILQKSPFLLDEAEFNQIFLILYEEETQKMRNTSVSSTF